MLWGALIIAWLLRLRLDGLVALVALWLFVGWVAADRPHPTLVFTVLGIAGMVAAMYVLSFPRRK